MAETIETSETDVFELGQETKVEEPFKYEEEAPNLVTEFKKHPEGRASLKRIATKCLNDFDNARRATEDFRKKNAEIWKLFAGTLDAKENPAFKDMSNLHVPILMENTLRMVYRQEYELFGNWTQVFGVTPLGPDDEHTAKLLSLHGNWQLRKRIPDFKRQIGHRGLLMFNLFGDATCHSFWDPQRRCNRHEMLTAEEFVCANTRVSVMPDYSDCAWKAKILSMDPHEVRKMGYGDEPAWEDVGTVLKGMPPDWEDSEISRELRDEVDRTMGVDSTAYQVGQFQIIQYEGWLNLPAQETDRYVKVMIDKHTQTVVHMTFHERTDPFEKRRFEFEQKQYQAWQQGQQEQQAFRMEQERTRQAAIELAHSQDPSSDRVTQGIAMARAVDDFEPPPEVPMPEWMHGNPMATPKPPAKTPIQMFTHFVNIEPLEGILGLGSGAILGPLNKAANIALSMFTDQGMLHNMKNFLYKKELNIPSHLQLAPGKMHPIQGVVDFQKDLLPLDFGDGNPQLLQLIDIVSKSAQTVSNTPEVLSGEAGKSGETAQGLANRIEQATKMLSVPTGKYADGVSQVLINNAILNSLFLEDVEFFSVNNHDPELGAMGQQMMSVGREMYDRPYDVEFSADLKFTSTAQRIAEADALVQLPNAVPAMQQNFAFVYQAIRKSLEARNRYDMVGMMGAPPQPPPVFGFPTTPPAPPPGAVSPGPPGAQGQQPQPGGQQQQQQQAPKPPQQEAAE